MSQDNFSDVIELENGINGDGLWVVHLMSNVEIEFCATKYFAPSDAKILISKEVGVYHLRASWQMRGPLEIQCEGWPIAKLFVMWSLAGCESVTTALSAAAKKYEDYFCERPRFAFIRDMPRGIEQGIEVEDMSLFSADWMVRKCVVVGWQYK